MPSPEMRSGEEMREAKLEQAPIIETETSISYLGVSLEKAKNKQGQFVPKREQYLDFINDNEVALPLQRDVAVAFKNGEPILLEGGTSLGKTTTVRKMAAELGWEVHYANLNGATDVEDLMGRYIPNPAKNKPEDPEYIFADGKVTSGLRQEEGKVKVIILDEFNASAPNILIRLHEVLDALERGGDVILSEDASEKVAVDKGKTKVIALMNPPGKGYFGREPLDPAQLRRWIYKKLPSELPKETFSYATDALFGAAPESPSAAPDIFLAGREQALTPEQLQEIPGIREVLEKYKEFHTAAKELLKTRKVAEDQPQPFTYDDRMEPRRVRDFILGFYSGDISETFQQALRYYYANKLESDTDRKKLGELIRMVEYKGAPKESKRKGLEKDKEELQSKIDAVKEEILALKGLPEGDRRVLEGMPRSPEASFSPEHLKAFAEVFGVRNKLEAIPMPSPETLTDEYIARMYPETQQEEEKAKGLIAFRPSWWAQAAPAEFINTPGTTLGQLYVASMKAEARTYQGKTLFTESLQKPNYKDGTQAYGSVEGNNPSLDPLLPVIQEVFGKDQINRFNLTWDQVNNKLIPKVKEAIEKKWKEKKLPVPAFEVICTPALVANRAMRDVYPQNSSTTTGEWSSTPLLKEDGTDSGRRLVVGNAGGGGAAGVGNGGRGGAWVSLGFRLSVVSG